MPSGAYCLEVAIRSAPVAPALAHHCGTYHSADNVAVVAPEIDVGYGFAPAVSQVVVTEQGYANTDMCRWMAADSGIHH